MTSNSPLKHPPADYFPQGTGKWFEIPQGWDQGKKLFYYDVTVGEGAPDATVVMVHGNPECSYTYRHIRDTLMASGANLRIIAMDHIGFGLSDQATFEMIDIHHARNLRLLLGHLDLNDVSLVIHDWGGPIGVGAFADQPERVKNLLLMNTTIFPIGDEGLTYSNYPMSWMPWSKMPYFVPKALWGGVAAAILSEPTLRTPSQVIWKVNGYCLWHALRLFPKGSAEYVWSEQMRSRMNVKSSMRNVLQTPYWGHGWGYTDPTHGPQDNHTFYQEMREAVERDWGPNGRRIPVCGYFGLFDPAAKDSVISQWQSALPQMAEYTYRFPELGHFIEESKGPEMARSLLAMNGLAEPYAPPGAD